MTDPNQPDAPREHVVEAGEHLARIAARYGFGDWTAIWDHPANAALKRERKHPHILLPGDRIVIPALEGLRREKATGALHRFTLNRVPLRLRFKVSEHFRKSAPADALLGQVGAAAPQGPDAEGMMASLLPLDLAETILRLGGVERPVKIGALAPVTMPAGWRDRLNNLGYRPGQSLDPADPRFHSAIAEFQCDHGLKADGVCGPATQAKLVEIHGC